MLHTPDAYRDEFGDTWEQVRICRYYDDTEDKRYSEDDEGNLVMLCGQCHDKNDNEFLEHAEDIPDTDEDFARCEVCNVYHGEVLEHLTSVYQTLHYA